MGKARTGLGTSIATFAYVVLWYALNVGYNKYNKVTCNTFPYPWTVGCISLGAGLLYMVPVWVLGVRKLPKLSGSDVQKIGVIACLHMCGHYGAVMSMNAGKVSFTHIVKAAEPVFSTILSGLVTGEWAPSLLNLTLIPIVFGVAMASMTELSFTWASFLGAMVSNLAFALRSVYMKQALANKAECAAKNLTAANIYSVYTIFAFMLSIPMALYFEGVDLYTKWGEVTSSVSDLEIAKLNLTTGLFFYLYNESSSLALGNLNNVAHAVCNTVKRVVIMIAVDGASMSLQSWIGAGIAISGSLLFALVKKYVESQKKKKAT